MGQLTTYGRLAEQIDSPNASRAVGSAIGDNPIAFLIPCHRVIRSSGIIGEYRWGSIRKSLLLGWEAAQVNR
jgi:AraC family transcriptional regulator of adaptative response/methylated-DNA-[protein]-cysteine methyltransferase